MTGDKVIIRATQADLFYAGLITDATEDEQAAASAPDVMPEVGTITLVNGGKREAQWFVGELTGRRLLQYKTPAGNWRNPLPSEVATFKRIGG